MNIFELIYGIREILKEFTDDTKYTNSYLEYLVRLKRSAYIRREYSVIQRIIDMEVAQTICMPLELVPDSECPECGFDTDDCEVVRTVDKLPNTIEVTNKNLILRVAPIGVTKRPFEFISQQRAIYAGEGDYEINAVYAFYHPNGHIYLKSKKNFYKSLDAISVTAVFDNPRDVEQFKCGADGSNCYNPEIDSYPLKAWMADIIMNEVAQPLLRTKNVEEDTKNNSNDDT